MGIYKAGKPFTLLQEGAIDSYTKLLIHSNTSDGSTTFVDSSAGGHTITNTSVTHEDTQKKFGSTSMYFGGGTKYLVVAHHADFDFDGEFTIDFWAWQSAYGSQANNRFMQKGANQTDGFGIFTENGSHDVYFGRTDEELCKFTQDLRDSTWHHIAVTRQSDNKFRIYLDGILKDTSSVYADNLNDGGTLEIAKYPGGTNDRYAGYMDEIRISKGIARWTENFHPPSSPYPTFSTFNIDSVGTDISNKDIIFPSNPSEDSTDVAFGVSSNVGAPILDAYADGSVGVGARDTLTGKFEVHTDEPISGSKFSVSSGNDSYTKLLIHSDTVDGSTTFIDSSVNSHVLSGSGGMEHKTTQKKLGDTSLFYDGSDNRLNTVNHDGFTFGTGDFTIDMWYWVTNDGTENPLISKGYYTAGVQGWMLRVNEWDGGTVIFNPTNGTSSGYYYRSQPSAITEEIWQHIALVRSAGAIKVYINGTALTIHTETGDPGFDFTDNSRDLMIGHETTYQSGTGAHFSGYLDEVRVSKGIARWTSNFTPPTRPYGHALTVDGPKGNLYTVTDAVESHGSGSVFSVNSTGGLPVFNVLDNGCVTKPYHPAFSVGLSSTQHNIAVGSSYIPIQFNTDSGGGNFNQGGHYNTSNYTFTAPVTGKYQFNALIQIFNLDIDADYYEILLETSNKVYDAVMIDPNAFDQDVPYWYFNMSICTAMDVGDTCILNIRQLGNSSTAQADITANSVYSGYLVC